MDRPALLALAGGVLAGLVLAVLIRVIVRVLRRRFLVDIPAPDIGNVQCLASNQVRITWTIGTAPAGASRPTRTSRSRAPCSACSTCGGRSIRSRAAG